MTAGQFTRSELVLGSASTACLAASRVLVFGLGGVGGYCVEALARSGVGAFALVDKDEFSLSNLNRQVLATHESVGRAKVDVARERVLSINPGAAVDARRCLFLPATANEFDFSEYDYVVDCIDTVTAKLEVVRCAKAAQVPVISAMGTGNKLDATKFRVADIYETSVCPLARIMRKELRRCGVDRLKVVYSTEEPRTPHEDVTLEAEDAERRGMPPGSVAWCPSVAGLIMAGEVVKDLLSAGSAFPSSAE